MSNKTRKHIWPVSLVMSIAIIGALAAFLVLASNPGDTQAHGAGDHPDTLFNVDCADMTNTQRGIHNGIHSELPLHGTMEPCPDMDPNDDDDDDVMMDGATITSSSDTGSATIELKLTVEVPAGGVPVGGAFVLYLEDDYQEPDSISASDVYFVSTPARLVTGNGSRVYATQNPEIDTDDHFTKDKKDIDIRVSVPDMCANNEAACEGANGLMAGHTVTMVIQKSAGIKNPPEEGKHSTGYLIIGPADAVPSSAAPHNQPFNVFTALPTWAKIGISDVDNSRGYEMTVTGTGFNNGTTAGAHVLGTRNLGFHVAKWWNTLNCAEMRDIMKAAGVSDVGDNYCFNYDINEDNYTYMRPDATDNTVYTALSPEAKDDVSDTVQKYGRCATIIEDGTGVGDALVGSDDKVTVTFEVTAPTFIPGNNNYICMVDGEGRASHRDVEDFNLEPSIKVVPSSANAGDTVNVFAQDFPNARSGFSELKIANQVVAFETSRAIGDDGSGTVTFEVPGGFEGVLRVDARWGDLNDADKCEVADGCVTEDSKITLAGAQLNVSKNEALPNETLTITGSGFGSQSCIPVANIRLEDVPVVVDDDSTANSGDCDVRMRSRFPTPASSWPPSSCGPRMTRTATPTRCSSPAPTNSAWKTARSTPPSANITIAEPTVKVTPDIAGPRDYITITGENWAVDNPDSDESPSITCPGGER